MPPGFSLILNQLENIAEKEKNGGGGVWGDATGVSICHFLLLFSLTLLVSKRSPDEAVVAKT